MFRVFITFRSDEVLLTEVHESKREEYPSPHDFDEGDIAVEIHDDQGEIYDGTAERFHRLIHNYRLIYGRLIHLESGAVSRALVIPRTRMRGGVLEDYTPDGWRRRVVQTDEGQLRKFYAIGPRRRDGKTAFVELEKPGPSDRVVAHGPEQREVFNPEYRAS